MRLVIVRHGETTENADRIIQGQTFGELSRLGREQAKLLSLRLKDEKFDIIYASDLKRVVETAKEIAKYHIETPLKLDARIRERSYGELEGTIFPDDWDWNNIPACVETNAVFDERVKDFFEDIIKRHARQTVLVVSHGCIKKRLISWISDSMAAKVERMGDVRNTSVSVLDIETDGNHKLHLLNCTRHLECDKEPHGK